MNRREVNARESIVKLTLSTRRGAGATKDGADRTTGEEFRVGVMCASCGSHEPMPFDEFADRFIRKGVAGWLCECGESDLDQISVYRICPASSPCDDPECLCKQGARP